MICTFQAVKGQHLMKGGFPNPKAVRYMWAYKLVLLHKKGACTKYLLSLNYKLRTTILTVLSQKMYKTHFWMLNRHQWFLGKMGEYLICMNHVYQAILLHPAHNRLAY